MLNFEEELKRFRPSLEIGNVEDAIGKEDMTDMTPDDGTFEGKRELTVGRMDAREDGQARSSLEES